MSYREQIRALWALRDFIKVIFISKKNYLDTQIEFVKFCELQRDKEVWGGKLVTAFENLFEPVIYLLFSYRMDVLRKGKSASIDIVMEQIKDALRREEFNVDTLEAMETLHEIRSLVSDLAKELLEKKDETGEDSSETVNIEEEIEKLPFFPGARTINPIEFLKTHCGQWLHFFGAENDKLFQYQMRKNENARKLLESARNHLNDLRRKKRPLIVGDIDLSPAPTIDQVVPSILDEMLERGEQMGTKEKRRFSSASALAAGRERWEEQRKAEG